MRVLSAEQIRAADQYTIQNEPISSVDLMERASEAFVAEFVGHYGSSREVCIFCGTGNNGGDGLAIGRILLWRGYHAQIWVCGEEGKGSPDFLTNYKRLSPQPQHLQSEEDFPALPPDAIVIDALFGSGLNRPLGGLPGALVRHLNASRCTIVSVDVASGLFIDKAVDLLAPIIRPAHTISFQVPKLAFFQPDIAGFVGEWHVVDIGLDQEFIQQQDTAYFLTESDDMRGLIPIRDRFMHKGVAGRVALWAGSQNKMGAAILAAQACLRSGVGLLWMDIPQEGNETLNVAAPEAMLADTDELLQGPSRESLQVLGAGPGIGTDDKARSKLQQLLSRWDKPVVLDADAITLAAQHPDLLAAVPPQSILTPHPGEFRRLVGDWQDDYAKLELLRDFCRRHQLNLVLKGAFSAVCNSDGEVYFNPTGNPGMATGGSGDVLFGIVSGLLAQGLAPGESLRLAVYLHGLAGDIAKKYLGEHSLLATDIIHYLPNSFMENK